MHLKSSKTGFYSWIPQRESSRGLFEQRFGVEALYQDALDILLPVEYPKAVEEAGIEPVDRPEIDVEKIEKGESLIFTAKVTVKPEVKLGDYKGLGIEKMTLPLLTKMYKTNLKRFKSVRLSLS